MRVFAKEVGRFTLWIGALVAAVATVAGATRLLPWLLAPHVPLRVAPALARSVVGVALETALFVAPSIGTALAFARAAERGEVRALEALGASRVRLLTTAWPAALGCLALSVLASAAWGTEAAAPGRAVHRLIVEARATCLPDVREPMGIDVPATGVAWVCFPGEAPRAAVFLPFSGKAAVVTASALELSDDLRALRASDVKFAVTSAEERVFLRAADASFRGLPPVGRSSNLNAFFRVLTVATTSIVLAALAAFAVLRFRIDRPVIAAAVGASGPGTALLVFSALERGPSEPRSYVLVPLAGALALLLAARLQAAWTVRRARHPRPSVAAAPRR